MRTPVRVGTIASTFLLLLVLWTIFHHSEYLKDRWDHLDDIKDDLTEGLKTHLGGYDKPAVPSEYIGFAPATDEPEPTPKPTPQPTPVPAEANSAQDETSSESDTDQASADPETTTAEEETNPEATTPEDEQNPESEEFQEDAAEGKGEENFDELKEELPDKIVVMGKMPDDDTSWVKDNLPDWQNAVYHVNDTDAPLHTPMNKGREAMAYLTYIIDFYGRFPSTVAFLHSHQDRFWHSQGMPGRSNEIALKALNLDYIQENGFANLRCTLGPGCPAEVQPFREDTPANRLYERNMSTVWETFFDTPCPEVIAAPCCAQFVVSRAQIMARPLEDYVMYRQWLMDTTIDDDNSGRIFEYLWHIIFGQEPVYCPSYSTCWHNVYGGKSIIDINKIVHGSV